MAQVSKNPAMRKEMMRNVDRAMANIENLPGGMSALQKFYHASKPEEEVVRSPAVFADSFPM